MNHSKQTGGVQMFVRAYLRASTKEQDARRAKGASALCQGPRAEDRGLLCRERKRGIAKASRAVQVARRQPSRRCLADRAGRPTVASWLPGLGKVADRTAIAAAPGRCP